MSTERLSASNTIQSGGFIKQHHSMLVGMHQVSDVLLIWGLLALLVNLAGHGWEVCYQVAAFVGSLSYHILAHKNGLYFSWRGQSLLHEVKTVFTTWLIVLGTLLTFEFIFDLNESFGGGVMVAWALAVPVGISFYRVSARIVLREMRRTGVNTRKVAIVGAKEPGLTLARSILQSPWMGMDIAGFYDNRVTVGGRPLGGEKLQVLGDIEFLKEQARSGEFDDIYIALPMREEETIKELVEFLANSSCCVHIVPDVFTFKMLNARSREIGGLPVVSVYDTPFDSFDAVVKRVEDVVLSSIILCLIAVPMLFIAAAVKFTSKGPVIFKQRRYGINGEEIMVWKFRSMTTCDNGNVVVQAQKNDARITKVGTFIRRTSLDELPQFINVLQGKMSIVGPRPHAVAHNELYRDQISGYMQRHLVKPGITGWAQVNGWRGETDTLQKMQKRIEFDLFYIRNWSVWMDLKIVCATVFKGFVAPQAY
ncbi:UDP-glucose:undecaprenyl-phosphate glucose-1-phosphate transferase [Zhongshania aliphaticivorans]|uniref:UDP-glucose:undecaprenyl-phosphate glucose-1-phosphate transferase n=1 Tax=Zhongshania aliphaticivorans TaxID=1470434 RepID=A0A5S9PN63_9GAMM|nr:undecaprenyl-phosphate glucose phosphotransferase [Zhongshania aliphaticivorans]CAA0105566.1 UDP-glucose:undecaprenyl-phosphate glucose-1-phosphate transferase [Zhongshania aliphaticivorans]CAA0105858.1 UDP-glucose:undecaprenyl-phosphate glucose-1-phosphate transferase [Zhongshania aliphaticivorans]